MDLEYSQQHRQATVRHMGYCHDKYEAMQLLQTFMRNKRLVALRASLNVMVLRFKVPPERMVQNGIDYVVALADQGMLSAQRLFDLFFGAWGELAVVVLGIDADTGDDPRRRCQEQRYEAKQHHFFFHLLHCFVERVPVSILQPIAEAVDGALDDERAGDEEREHGGDRPGGRERQRPHLPRRLRAGALGPGHLSLPPARARDSTERDRRMPPILQEPPGTAALQQRELSGQEDAAETKLRRAGAGIQEARARVFLAGLEQENQARHCVAIS